MAFRTQKISQMTPKGANLEATDLIEVSTIESGSYVTRSITGQEIIDAAVGNVDWGDIGGTLSAQTDLQNALDAKVPTSRTLTINGVTQDLSADRTFTISTGITIGSTAIASGVVGRVLFEGAGNVVQESSSLFWDATNNRLGIGTSSPFGSFDVRDGDIFATISSNANLRSRLTYQGLYVSRSTDGGYTENIISTSSAWLYSSRNSHSFFRDGVNLFNVGGGFASGAMNINTNGNVLIGTTTDAGFRLDVNGTARVQGLTTLAGTMTASGAIARNGLINGTLVAAANNDVLVGLDINPTFTNGAFTGVQNIPLRLNASDTQSGALGVLNIIGSDAFAQVITMQPVSATYSGTKTIGFKAVGTSGQAMGIGTNFSSGTPQYLTLFNSTGVRFALFNSTGNIGINTTTDAGFRLDVNGTARVKGTGTSISTFAFNVENSAGTETFRVYDNGLVRVLGGAIVMNGSNGSFTAGFIATAGQIGAGTTSVTASAQLEISSTTKGFLPPRMTTTQKNAIASPAAGLMVYDTTLNVISYYNGTMWI